MDVKVFGIRHHGIGSAKHVKNYLHTLRPDFIMIEGPPEITEVLKYIGHEKLVPPVALMVYNIDNPQMASFYPFTSFSPEWVAIKYAIENRIPFKAIDMPAAIAFAYRDDKEDLSSSETSQNNIANNVLSISDPMHDFAVAAGYTDSETWWDYSFERHYKNDSTEHFEAIHTAITEMRNHDHKNDQQNKLREAFMREEIRSTANNMYTNIAVVCGAWHGPEIKKYDTLAKEDAKLLKTCIKSKIKVATTWIPWTNERLSMISGYGAGIYSPGWYEHLWTHEQDTDISWLIKVAKTFRAKSIDVSSAHLIEAQRMAQSLASIRNKASVTLDELNDATQSIICMGESVLLNYIKKELIIADKIGIVPDDIPKVPIQEDFEKTLKSLRLILQPKEKQIDLDLRNANDLSKSILFYRLEVLGVKLATRTFKRSKGTFRESWMVYWSPEMMIDLIDKAYLGNTIEIASTNLIKKEIESTTHIKTLAAFFEKVIPAELFDLVDDLLIKMHSLSSISSDITDLMTAIVPLIEVARYGNVRKSDLQVLNTIVENLVQKIIIGLPNACYGLDEESANHLIQLIFSNNDAIKLIDNNIELTEEWYLSISHILEKDNIHPLIQGCSTRLLLDNGIIDSERSLTFISLALSQANDAMHAAFWLEGFLRGSASILIYDHKLWNILYSWLEALSNEEFDNLLPYLRRSFSKFEFAERREIGEKAKKGILKNETIEVIQHDSLDKERGMRIVPVVLKLLSIKTEAE
jgi:hypothetical protein